MEELLNKLIEKGWKVYHRNYNKCVNVWRNCAYFMYRDEYGRPMSDKSFSLRELVAKESGLWQFVCENDMVDRYKYDSKTYEVRIENWIKRREIGPEGEVSTKESWRGRSCAEYWIIESALCDEDKLESFILDNIKIDE